VQSERVIVGIRRHGPWQVRDAIAALALFFGLQIGGSLLVRPVVETNAEGLTLASLLLSVGSALGAVTVVSAKRRVTAHRAGLVPLDRAWVWRCLVLGVVLLVARQMLALAAVALQPGLQQGSELLTDVLFPDETWARAAIMLLGGVVAPFGEELLFRGVLYEALRNHWRFWPSAVVSSLIFGAMHMIPIQILMAALLGVALCWTYERSQSLWAPVLIHMVNNLVAFSIAYVGLSMSR